MPVYYLFRYNWVWGWFKTSKWNEEAGSRASWQVSDEVDQVLISSYLSVVATYKDQDQGQIWGGGGGVGGEANSK